LLPDSKRSFRALHGIPSAACRVILLPFFTAQKCSHRRGFLRRLSSRPEHLDKKRSEFWTREWITGNFDECCFDHSWSKLPPKRVLIFEILCLKLIHYVHYM
jgi:hypothetical protein